MPKIDVYDIKGKKISDVDLNEEVFGIKPNETIVHTVLVNYLANQRQGTQSTKTRAEVRGGGRKPWRQKGTGRARQGSTRATQWRGGGIAGGVNPRDYAFKMNKKERVLAIKSALTHKVNAKELVVVESLSISSMKTKEVKSLIESMKLTGKVLFIAATETDIENLYMATRNLGYAYVILADEINVFDLINADSVVVEEAAIKEIEEALK